jgi:hypothetical protein
MQDNLHPEITAAGGIITGVILHYSPLLGFHPGTDDAAEILICVMWSVNRLAKHFFPDKPGGAQ